jgi:hypothetical protein
VEIGEAAEKLDADARAVAGRELAVAGPDRHGLGREALDARDDAIEGLVPGRPAEFVAALVANERIQQSGGVAYDFFRRVSPDAEEAAAVGIVLVALDAHERAVAHLREHPAEGRMTAHRAHSADDYRIPHAVL